MKIFVFSERNKNDNKLIFRLLVDIVFVQFKRPSISFLLPYLKSEKKLKILLIVRTQARALLPCVQVKYYGLLENEKKTKLKEL